MKKILGIFGFMAIALTLSFAPLGDNKYSEENTVLDTNCSQRYDDCDGLASLLGDMYEMSYEEEHNSFTYCMETGGC